MIQCPGRILWASIFFSSENLIWTCTDVIAPGDAVIDATCLECYSSRHQQESSPLSCFSRRSLSANARCQTLERGQKLIQQHGRLACFHLFFRCWAHVFVSTMVFDTWLQKVLGFTVRQKASIRRPKDACLVVVDITWVTPGPNLIFRPALVHTRVPPSITCWSHS